MSTEHPDEGTIHAWLDGELAPAESARLEAHVAGCAACQLATAEARGLIAGATRIVRETDEGEAVGSVGGAAAFGAATVVAPPAEGSAWRALRVTPARAAIAATLLVVAGITMTHEWVARDSEIDTRARGGSTNVASAPASAPGRGRDPLLDSAIARNIANAMPPRTLERAEGTSVAVTPAVVPSPTTVDTMAPLQVAQARRNLRVRRETASVAADNVAIRGTSSAPASAAAGVAAANLASAATASRPPDVNTTAIAGQCLRIESPAAGARWGMVALPFTVVLSGSDADHGSVRVVGESTGSVSTLATWSRQNRDSLLFVLRRLGYTGSLQLTLDGDVRGGVMRSAPSAVQLNEVVATGAGDAPGQPAPAPRAMGTLKVRQAPTAATQKSAEAVEVLARRVQCP